MIQKETLFYTYLDECKRNYLSGVMKPYINKEIEEYSITSVTFEQEYYKSVFEPKWIAFREKYNIDSTRAMHFVDYKKLIDPKQQTEDNNSMRYFLDEKGNFSIELLKLFFHDLKQLLDTSEFFIVHTDFYWEKQQYLTSRKKIEQADFKKKSRNIAPNILNAVPYLAMRKQLDLLMLCLLKQNFEGNETVEPGRYLDVELPKKINTKLRFDADGKEFDARKDLKQAYNHTITVGSDTVNNTVSSEILDEIRFIRKEEVGHKYTPNHCGLEIVDMLCSMIAGETRLIEYKKAFNLSSEKSMKEGVFINLQFPDGEKICFDSILREKLLSKHIEYCPF